MERRAFLRTLLSSGALVIAGCSARQDRGMLDLWIENTRSDRATVRTAFIRPDVSDHSSAVAYGENFDLAPAETVSREAVASNQPYRIEVELDGADAGETFISYHHHYRPFEQEHVDLRITVTLRHDGVKFDDTF